jgi:hypothetical protein
MTTKHNKEASAMARGNRRMRKLRMRQRGEDVVTPQGVSHVDSGGREVKGVSSCFSCRWRDGGCPFDGKAAPRTCYNYRPWGDLAGRPVPTGKTPVFSNRQQITDRKPRALTRREQAEGMTPRYAVAATPADPVAR